jgi:outer membrane biosynthesis protein TonB
MTKKLLTAALAIAACATLWGAVCPQNASDGKVPAADQVTSTAAAAQEEHTGAIPLSAAEKEYAPAEETNPPLPTEAPEPAPVMAETQLPAAPPKETAAPEVKPAQAPQPVQSPQPEQPQPSADPAPGERSAAGGKAQVWVPGFGWVEDGGGNVCTYAEDLYENGNKIGSMG